MSPILTRSLVAAAAALCAVAPVHAADVSACLITKTDTNPFFVKMKEGAQAKAKELGVTLKAYAGKIDGDTDSQVQAIETCIAAGVKGILLVPSDSVSLVPQVKKARDAGILVIALDTPLDPIESADATFATDNFEAGVLIGKWSKEFLGADADKAKIAFLDGIVSQPTVDVLRDQGFMQGFGIDIADPKVRGDEKDPRIVGHDVTSGSEEGGQKAMENLFAQDKDINLVYSINEAAAAGAYKALQGLGREKDVVIATVDGGCPGVKAVKDGMFGATSQQYPLKMAAYGIEAIAQYAKDGTLPKPTEGKQFFDTGVALVTDKPMPGVESITSEEGLKLCWG